MSTPSSSRPLPFNPRAASLALSSTAVFSVPAPNLIPLTQLLLSLSPFSILWFGPEQLHLTSLCSPFWFSLFS